MARFVLLIIENMCVRASARQVRTYEAVSDSEGSGTTDSEHDIERDSTSSSD